MILPLGSGDSQSVVKQELENEKAYFHKHSNPKSIESLTQPFQINRVSRSHSSHSKLKAKIIQCWKIPRVIGIGAERPFPVLKQWENVAVLYQVLAGCVHSTYPQTNCCQACVRSGRVPVHEVSGFENVVPPLF